MPKSKTTDKKEIKPIKSGAPLPADDAEKIIEIAEVETDTLDDDLADGEDGASDLEDDDAALDDEEVDPFKDKYEE